MKDDCCGRVCIGLEIIKITVEVNLNRILKIPARNETAQAHKSIARRDESRAQQNSAVK
jgi:hypothetical protein